MIASFREKAMPSGDVPKSKCKVPLKPCENSSCLCMNAMQVEELGGGGGNRELGGGGGATVGSRGPCPCPRQNAWGCFGGLTDFVFLCLSGDQILDPRLLSQEQNDLTGHHDGPCIRWYCCCLAVLLACGNMHFYLISKISLDFKNSETKMCFRPF